MLGGFELPGQYTLIGHSDADVVLHALCDALGGAMGVGDIGEHFPDTQEDNKNRNSVDFLDHFMELMKQKKYRIMNIDITLIGEKPKIMLHRNHIQQSLANLLDLESGRIGLKATTTEQMGALGRAEGLACMASVLLFSKI